MLQIVKSVLESSSDSSSSDDEDILEILSALNECENVCENSDDYNDLPPPPDKRSARRFQNKFFGDIHKSSYFTAIDFKKHFCISRTSFEELLTFISSPTVQAGRPPIPTTESLLITIWTIMNQEPYRLIAERFGISVGHSVRVYHETCVKLFNQAHRFIVWPSGKEAVEISELYGPNQLPHVFGCVGTTHLIIPSSQTDITYYDRKGNHSIIVQAVCRSNGMFMNLNIGSPGSLHYANVWINSGIYKKLCEDPSFLPTVSYLVADGSYPLNNFLMVPFRDYGTDGFDWKMKKFNETLMNSYSIVYRAFGRLKGLFKRLKFLNIIKLDNVKHAVTTACILHNLSIRDGVTCTDIEAPYLDTTEIDPVFKIMEDKDSAIEFRLKLMNNLTSTIT